MWPIVWHTAYSIQHTAYSIQHTVGKSECRQLGRSEQKCVAEEPETSCGHFWVMLLHFCALVARSEDSARDKCPRSQSSAQLAQNSRTQTYARHKVASPKLERRLLRLLCGQLLLPLSPEWAAKEEASEEAAKGEEEEAKGGGGEKQQAARP